MSVHRIGTTNVMRGVTISPVQSYSTIPARQFGYKVDEVNLYWQKRAVAEWLARPSIAREVEGSILGTGGAFTVIFFLRRKR